MAKYALKTSTCEKKTEETNKHSCEEKLKKKPVGEVKYSCSGDVSAPRVLWGAFELGIEQDNEQDIELGIGQDVTHYDCLQDQFDQHKEILNLFGGDFENDYNGDVGDGENDDILGRLGNDNITSLNGHTNNNDNNIKHNTRIFSTSMVMAMPSEEQSSTACFARVSPPNLLI